MILINPGADQLFLVIEFKLKYRRYPFISFFFSFCLFFNVNVVLRRFYTERFAWYDLYDSYPVLKPFI